MSSEKTIEPQYQQQVELKQKLGLTRLGIKANHLWHEDPKRLMIRMARYKFVSKMLSGKNHVLEIGCGDAFSTRIIVKEVGRVCAVDFDPVFINDIKERMDQHYPFDCHVHDMLSGPVEGNFDAAYSLDVIEHILPRDEHLFMANIAASLQEQGVFIVGSPSLQSQQYASQGSKDGHVNCKDHKGLKDLMSHYFHNVFIFSMNDEVVHTGFYPMAHYLIAICAGKKKTGA